MWPEGGKEEAQSLGVAAASSQHHHQQSSWGIILSCCLRMPCVFQCHNANAQMIDRQSHDAHERKVDASNVPLASGSLSAETL